MTDNKPTVQQKEQRRRPRRQIPKSLDAKVTVWTHQGAEDGQNKASEQHWEGRLSNICERGALILLDAVYWEQLRPNQSVKLQFNISSSETENKTKVIGNVRYILPDEEDNRIKLGIEFLEYELQADTKQSICRIFEILETCPECKFDECQNL